MKGSKAEGPPIDVNPGEEEAFALFNSIFEAYVKHNGAVDEKKPPNVEVSSSRISWLRQRYQSSRRC